MKRPRAEASVSSCCIRRPRARKAGPPARRLLRRQKNFVRQRHGPVCHTAHCGYTAGDGTGSAPAAAASAAGVSPGAGTSGSSSRFFCNSRFAYGEPPRSGPQRAKVGRIVAEPFFADLLDGIEQSQTSVERTHEVDVEVLRGGVKRLVEHLRRRFPSSVRMRRIQPSCRPPPLPLGRNGAATPCTGTGHSPAWSAASPAGACRVASRSIPAGGSQLQVFFLCNLRVERVPEVLEKTLGVPVPGGAPKSPLCARAHR